MQNELALRLCDDFSDVHVAAIPTAVVKQLHPVDPTRSNPNPDCGERALLRAVLQDAILCLTGQGVEKHERAKVAAEAQRWIMSRSRRWLFAFESICDVLDINPEYLRDKLLRNPSARPKRAKGPAPRSASGRSEEDIVRAFRKCRLRGNQTTRTLR